MEFALSEDQRMLQDSLSGLLAREAPLDRIRTIASGDEGERLSLETSLAAFGLSGLLIAEPAGGQGLGLLEACLVEEAIGYHLAPSGFMTAALAGLALREHDSLGPLIARGEARFALALTEAVSRRDAAGFSESREGVAGVGLLALAAADPTHLLVQAGSGRLLVLDAASAEISPLQTIDRTRTFSKIAAGEAAPLAVINPGPDYLAAARLLVAADTLGAAQAMIDKAVAYAQERQQFGRPIGSFQAVKHMCAEMAARLEPARALVWHAAHALDTGDPEGPVMAHLAKAHLAEAGTFIARTATEVHGGMGFTDLLGLHFWFKRIGVNRQLLGSPEQARESAAALQGLV